MGGDESEFAAWYAVYPRKVARADAWRAWVATRRERPALAEMVAATGRYVAWRTHLQSRGEFCPPVAYPATWLRAGRWADEFDMPVAAAPALSAADRAAAEAAASEREARATADRMARARAASAWGEVLAARKGRSMPLGGFQDARAGQVLAAVGGWRALDACESAKGLMEIARRFEAAYLRESEPSGRVIELRKQAGS